MKRILCYGDSNTWGYNAAQKHEATGLPDRFDENTRWTGIMRNILGPDYFVWEAGLGGRTTAFDDPLMPTRNGVKDFEMCLQMCDPVDCIIFALGTNDTKDLFNASSLIITSAMERLLNVCNAAMCFSRSPNAQIILACPMIPVADGNGEYQYGFSELSTQRGEELRQRYRLLAEQKNCAFIDLNALAKPSAADGVHLDPAGHKAIGHAMAKLVQSILSEKD